MDDASKRSLRAPMTSSWERVRSWLRENVPALDDAIVPPVASSVLATVEREIGVVLHDDLREWWRQSDGVVPGASRDSGHLLPGYDFYGVAAALRSRQVWLQVRQEAAQRGGDGFDRFITDQEGKPAGTPCEIWLSAWVPIAGSGGGEDLFVDLRSGPLSGCVANFDRVSGAAQPPIWSRVGVMLQELADALEHQTPLWDLTPAVFDEELDWI